MTAKGEFRVYLLVFFYIVLEHFYNISFYNYIAFPPAQLFYSERGLGKLKCTRRYLVQPRQQLILCKNEHS